MVGWHWAEDAALVHREYVFPGRQPPTRMELAQRRRKQRELFEQSWCTHYIPVSANTRGLLRMSLVQTLGRQLPSRNFCCAWEVMLCDDEVDVVSKSPKLWETGIAAQGDNRLSDSHCGRLAWLAEW